MDEVMTMINTSLGLDANELAEMIRKEYPNPPAPLKFDEDLDKLLDMCGLTLPPKL